MGSDPPERAPAADAPLAAGKTVRRGQTMGNCGAQSYGDYDGKTGTCFKFAACRKLNPLCQPGCWKAGSSKPSERAGHKATGSNAPSPAGEGAMAAQPPDPLRPK